MTQTLSPYSVKLNRKGNKDVMINHKKQHIQEGLELIKAVNTIDYDGYVYDLVVPVKHNFAASLVYIHNCIDELDKMRAEDRSALHEAMEAQTITISKAGFHTILNARCPILAACNPQLGIYDVNLPFMDNVKLPPPLISRFDLVIIMRDQPSKEGDEKLARFMLSLHENEGTDITPPIEFDLLKKYVAYAKSLKPEFTREASDVVAAFFMQLRKLWEPESVPVTPRAIESLVRLATARAKLLLADRVTEDDARTAVRLMERMVAEVGTNPKTGQFDSGVFTGTSTEQISKSKIIAKVIEEIRHHDGEMIDRNEFKDKLVEGGLSREDADKALRDLYRSSRLYEPKPGKLKFLYG